MSSPSPCVEVNKLMLFGDWVDPRPDPSRQYRALVSRVDSDGNEVAGIRRPDIAVPLGTHTGWNIYAEPFPEGELCDRDGSFAPFARTRTERPAAGDPRPSLEERYGPSARYAARIETVTRSLVQMRFLLPEDAERFVEAARSRRPVTP